MLSGKYEDDFEATLTADNASSAANEARPGDEAGSDCDESAVSESEGEEDDDALSVSFQDISTLRRSLEQDEIIRESLASVRKNNTASVSLFVYIHIALVLFNNYGYRDSGLFHA